MSEEWRSVVGYEGLFEVSDAGRVRSVDRVVNRQYRDGRVSLLPVEGKLLPLSPHPKTGHLSAYLQRPNRQYVRVLVHRAVLEAFVGPCPEGKEGCHRDGDVRNDAASNLYWGTRPAHPRAEFLSKESFFDEKTLARYQAKLAPPNDHGCILWMASRDTRGYGQFRVGERIFKSHQVAWILANGPIADGLEPDHLCEVTHCCNAAHLEAVTHAENMRRHGERMTHCRSGRHKWSEQVPLVGRHGRRECRPCRNERKRDLARKVQAKR